MNTMKSDPTIPSAQNSEEVCIKLHSDDNYNYSNHYIYICFSTNFNTFSGTNGYW